MDSKDRAYESPAITDRVPVGDPLILGVCIVSPRWRRPAAEPRSDD